jgi:hypothetical protein
MIAKIRTEYITMCPIKASDAIVLEIVEDMAEAIEREEQLKALGINLSEMFGNQ